MQLDLEVEDLDDRMRGDVVITLPMPVRPGSRASAAIVEHSGISLTHGCTSLGVRSLAGDGRRLLIVEGGAEVSPKPLTVHAIKRHVRLVFSVVYPI